MTLVLSPSEIVSKLERNGELGLLGKAPHWNRRILGELIDVQNGAPFSSDKFNREGIGMPLIRIRDVGAAETSTYFDGEYDPAYVVRAGDLLVGMDGDFRCAKWTSGNALLNQRVCRLTVKSTELDERFLFLILQGYLDAIWEETSATTVKHLSSKSLQEIPIPLPSIDEQHKIVELLEDLLSRLDVALADVKQAKVKAAQFRRSVLQAAFTGNLSGDGTRSLTGLPSGWKWSKIGEVADIVRGVTYSKGDTLSASDNDAVPLLRATNLEVNSIDFEDMVFVPKRVVKAQQYLQLDDILLAASSGSISVVGKSAQVVKANGETFGAFCAVIRPKNIDPKFLAYLVQSPAIRDHWSSTAKGTNINNLKPIEISETDILVPSIDEQHEIVELLEDHLSRLDASISLADAVERQSDGLRRSTLQAAFTGQLTEEVTSV